MKIMTILGTRPEIIRLSRIIPKLDQYCDHVLVHTGQNFDDNLSAVFFRDLGLRPPDHYLSIRGDTFGAQIGKIMIECEKVIMDEQPDRVLILGDTNSGLATIVARRMGIPVIHVEAGNRCFDHRVPEEMNRRIIDHASTMLLPYTRRSAANLLDEGIPSRCIHVVGNPIAEVIQHYSDKIAASEILAKLGLVPKDYFLVTMHRAESVDDRATLTSLLTGLDAVGAKYGKPVVCSLHPRSRNRMEQFGLEAHGDVRFFEPFGFFDFIALAKSARCVITDSGTVQEECCILRVPNVTIREVTERPETIESGSNILAGTSADAMLKTVEIATGENQDWDPPAEYLDIGVSSKVVKILLGYLRKA